MSWQKYDLVFRLLAPMHIGWRKISNLQQTRGYVTGKIFWAALTARLTRETDKGADGQAYKDIGDLVQKKFRFNYFYPATHNGNGYKTNYPWEDDFDYLFLDSHTSTALNYDNQSAEDGLLHETEFIAPHTRTDKPVYLRGSLYARTDLPEELQNWQIALNKLQLGGERGYGWGRVQLISCDETGTVESEHIQIELAANDRITAHLIVNNTAGITGPIEPLIGWERNNRGGPPWKLSDQAIICYTPGSITATGNTFTIGDFGLWQQFHNS